MDSLITEDVTVLLRRDAVCKPLRLKRGRKVNLDKLNFFPDNALGRPYGSSFEVRGNQLLFKPSKGATLELSEDAAGVDNRSLLCDGSAQKLTEQDIAQMKAEGYTGQAIVESVIENSKSFSEKTIFAQEKYIKKKESRHVAMVTFLKPSTKLLCEMYYSRAPSRTCHLRLDTIAQILTQVNARAASKLLLVETCQGLLAGALLERLGGSGNLVQVFFGDSPSRSFLDNFGHLSEQDMCPLMMYPLHKVGSLLDPAVIQGSLSVQALLKQHESSDPLLGNDGPDVEGVASSVTKGVMEDEGGTANDGTPCSEQPDSNKSPTHSNKSPSSKDQPSPPPKKKLRQDGEAPDGAGGDVVVGREEEEEEVVRTGEEVVGTGVSTQITRRRIKPSADAEAARDSRRRLREEEYSKAEELLKQRMMDGLVVACKFHPEPILMTLMHFVAPSRPFVVYCPALEPLVSCFTSLKGANCAFSIQLFETWTRKYQVLPSRTHPEMSMDGQSGYILVGTTVRKQMVT